MSVGLKSEVASVVHKSKLRNQKMEVLQGLGSTQIDQSVVSIKELGRVRPSAMQSENEMDSQFRRARIKSKKLNKKLVRR